MWLTLVFPVHVISTTIIEQHQSKKKANLVVVLYVMIVISLHTIQPCDDGKANWLPQLVAVNILYDDTCVHWIFLYI